MKRKLTIVFAIVLAVGVITGCRESRPRLRATTSILREVAFGYQPFGNNLVFFVAVDKGFFEKHGLRVKPVKIISANDAATALLHGDIVANATLPLNVMMNIEEQQPGRVKAFMFKTATASHSSDYLLAAPTSPITNPAQLAGHKIAGYPGTAQQTILKLILKHFIDPSTATLIELPPTVQLQSLKTGQVDALLTYDETALTALDDGDGRVLMANPICKYVIDPFYGFAYAISGQFIKRDRESARALVAAMTDAADYIRDHESDSRRIMMHWTSSRPGIAQRMALWEQTPAERIDKTALRQLGEIYFHAGVTKRPIDPAELLITRSDLSNQ